MKSTSLRMRMMAVALAMGLMGLTSASASIITPTNSLTFQGVTFNTWTVDVDTMGLSILNALGATGNWFGIGFLSAFEIKDIVSGDGVVSSATISGSGTFGASVDGGVSASGVGCNTGGTPGACFTSSPAFALTNSMEWEIDFATTGGTLNFEAPHLKVAFLTNVTDTQPTGNLLSLPISPIPEPETYAMMLAGLGLMGAIARRRNKYAA